MTENKKVNGWKVTAIIFIILFTLQALITIWGLFLISEDERKTNECYYDICEFYADAYYEEDVCYCYDYDNDELVIARTKYMK